MCSYNVDNYKKWYNQDGFLMLYLSNRYLNEPCYSCPFRRTSSADIRLGDLMSKKYGELWYSPSCICVNTKIGMEYFRRIEDFLEYCEIDYSEIDDIQQKEHMLTAYDLNPMYDRLEDVDVTPRRLLGFSYYLNYGKSLIKIPLILVKGFFSKDDLLHITKGELK